MTKIRDASGEVFGRLTILRRVSNRGERVYWLCRCECGNEKELRLDGLQSGAVQSCGCFQKEKMTKHGLSKHGLAERKLYDSWKNMLARCNNKSRWNYHNYGGRGIKVCEPWLDVKVFYGWAVELWRPGLLLDRIDNDGDYSPENCRFVTPQVSACNQRMRSRSKTGYVGVYKVKKVKSKNLYRSKVGGEILGYYDTVKEALEVRNKYIRYNKFPHVIQEYMGHEEEGV